MRLLSSRTTTAALLVALAPLGAAAAAQGTPAARHTLDGNDVAIYNLAGRLRVQRGTGDRVVVSVETAGSEARRLRVETGPIRGASTLRVVYPAERVTYREMGRGSSTSLRVRDDGTFSDGGDRRDGGRERIVVSGRDGGLDAHANLTVSVPPGKRVRLYLAVGDVSVTEVSADLLVDASAADVTATRTRGSLRVDTGSGSVRVSDAEGDLDVDTGSGDVELARVKGGMLKIDTGSGSVTSEGVEATRLEVDVGSGSIRLRGVRAFDQRLDSGSGEVDVALVGDVRSMVIDTGSGGVTLRVPPSLGAELEIDTGSGGIDADMPITVHRQSRDHLSGRLGDGQGRIRIDTGSGGVRLLRAS
jgi:lia operon protein LiaG